jgi:transglutaminase-like putative cysteine protease
VALTVAVLASAFLPSEPTLTLPGFGTGNSGPVRITDPIADLKRDLVLGADIPLLRVRVTSGPSSPAPSYVRLTVLDEFDGKSWRPGDHPRPQSQSATGEIPLIGLDPSQPGETIGWQVSVAERLASSWLPTPRHLRSIEAGSDWRYSEDTLDFRAADDDVTTAGLAYPLTEFRPTLTAEQLATAGPAPDQIRDDYTRLPSAADTLRAVAERETRGATTDYARGVALQRFFQSEFTYSTRIAPGNGLATLEHFLGPDGREGYCEQFAAAMAVLARELDIPARVSVGFLSGERSTTDTYEFSSHDLHAWPELYIAGAGWVMFEPTPTSHTVAVPGYTRASALPSTGPSASTTPSTVRPPTSPGSKPRPETGTSGQDASTGVLTTWLPAVGVGTFALLLLGALPRALRRRRRTHRLAAATPEEMWAELRDTAIDLGVPWPEERSPRATGLALADTVASVPEAPAALRRLVTTLETARYAPAGEQSPFDDQLAADTETCLGALRDGASPTARRRARWWPRSLRRRTTRSRARVRQELASGAVDQLDPPADG